MSITDYQKEILHTMLYSYLNEEGICPTLHLLANVHTYVYICRQCRNLNDHLYVMNEGKGQDGPRRTIVKCNSHRNS